MSMTDPIADFLTRIRNGQSARKKTIKSPSSTAKEAIANVLQDEGYILGYYVAAEGSKKTPSLRVYKGKDELPTVLGGLGVAIVSTASGMVSDKKARAAGQGGEVVCIVS